MTDKVKQDKENYLHKVTYYVFIFFLIAFFIFVVFYMQHQKMQYCQNHSNVSISANALSINEISNYDTKTDLSGTTWVFNDTFINYKPSSDSYYEFFVDFTCDNKNYTLMTYGEQEDEGVELVYRNINLNIYDVVYFGIGNAWKSNIYKTITITGGKDATNLDFISWLQSNATQMQNGYSSSISLTNCTSNKSSESGLSGQYTATITANTGYILSSVTTSLGTVTYSNDNKVATITIPDVTEDFTITATANLIYHTISYRLGNVVVISNKPTQIDEISTISITFQPYSNYVLPQYINVEGVTSFQWNKDTGVLTLSNAFDNVEITLNAEYKSGQYTFVELIDSVTLVPINTFFNLFNFEIFGVNIYSLLLSSLVLFVIIKVILKVFK